MYITKQPWININIDKLPNECFLDQGNRKYPYRFPDTASETDSQGRHTKAGDVSYWQLIQLDTSRNSNQIQFSHEQESIIQSCLNNTFQEQHTNVAIEAFYGDLEGTLEKHLELVNTAARNYFKQKYGESDDQWVYTSVVGTYENACVVNVEVEKRGEGVLVDKVFAVAYMTDESGEVSVTNVKEVKISLVLVAPTEGSETISMGATKSDKNLEQAFEHLVNLIGYEKCSESMNKISSKVKTKAKKTIIRKAGK